MDETELKALFDSARRDSLGYLSGTLATERAGAMDFYLGKPFGNEIEGRSKVVATEVADVIEWMLPSLVRIFTAGNEVARFEPVGPEDEAAAAQATDYVNHIFQNDNPGFSILYDWFKDALLQKNGIVKVYWDERVDVGEETYTGLDDMQFAEVSEDPDVDIIEHTAYPDTTAPPVPASAVASLMPGAAGAGVGVAPPPLLHDTKVKRKRKTGRCCIEPIPPEEFLISRDARTLPTARFCGHRTAKTLSDLKAMGFDTEKIDHLYADDGPGATSDLEVQARDLYEEDNPHGSDVSERDAATRKVWLTDGYLRVDYDGDGIAELRHIMMAGGEILRNEVTDIAPFADLTPIRMPHRWVGRSMADLVSDLQLIKSTILRQLLDNLYLTNTPMVAVDDTVNLDDLLNPRPGGLVRFNTGGDNVGNHFRVLEVPATAAASLPFLEYMDAIRENRTGVTRYNQGLDANSLNKTATGITNIMQASQQRLELIARNFAETGVKQLFRLVLRCVCKYQDKARIIRLRNKWVPIDPRAWTDQMDCSVTVGLGTGDRQQQATLMMGFMQIIQQVAVAQGGLEGPIFTWSHLHTAIKRYLEAIGQKNTEEFASDPRQMPKPQPKPDPKAQAVMAKTRADIQAIQAKTQATIRSDQAKAQAKIVGDMIHMQQEGQIRQAEAAHDASIKADEAAQNLMLDRMKGMAKAAAEMRGGR